MHGVLTLESFGAAWRGEAELGSYPIGESGNRIIGLWRAPSHHLETVDHLWEHVESDLDSGFLRLLSKHEAVYRTMNTKID
jgi:hypothetical protein